MDWLLEVSKNVDDWSPSVFHKALFAGLIVPCLIVASRRMYEAIWDIFDIASRSDDKVRSFSLDLFLPFNVARDAQASLEEVFPIWEAAHGKPRALWIRRIQIVRIVVGHHFIPVITFFERVMKIVGGKAAD